MGITIYHQTVAFSFTVGVVGEGAHTTIIRQLSQLPEMVVGEATGCCSSSAINYGVGGSKVQATSMLVGMILYVTTCIRHGSEAVVSIVGLHYGSAVGVGLAQLQLCVSRLKLIDSVRLNEKNV